MCLIKPVSAYEQYPTTIGVEYALIPEGINYDLDWRDLDKKFNRIISEVDNNFKNQPNWKKLIFRNKKNKCGKLELGAVEYSSTPLKSVKEVGEFHKYVNKLFDFAGQKSGFQFVANTEADGVYIEGGGGHIHLGAKLPGKSQQDNDTFRRNLAIFMLNHPIIQWFMSEWCDDDILTSTYYNALQQELECKVSKFSTQLIAPHLDLYSGGWGRSPAQIRTNPTNNYKDRCFDTVEIRCLAAPTSYQHLLDNIDLCCKIWEYVEQYSRLLRLKYESVDQIKEYHEDIKNNPVGAFKDVLETIGLDAERYKKYEHNYRMREENGIFYSHNFAGIEIY